MEVLSLSQGVPPVTLVSFNARLQWILTFSSGMLLEGVPTESKEGFPPEPRFFFLAASGGGFYSVAVPERQ